MIREVLRHDPPVHNTRRFIAADGAIAGQRVAAGDTVLVVLAAANHDAAANPHPERFDVARVDRRTFTFGDVSNIAQTPLGEAVQPIFDGEASDGASFVAYAEIYNVGS